jgi:hypothetical protein
MTDRSSNLARKFEDIDHHEAVWVRPAAPVVAFKRKPKMTSRIVDVFDSAGGHVAAYTVCLEDEDCLDCEFEEMAILFAEQSGRVDADEIDLLIARCHRD